jgi:isoquinoline 1-oxidoreductase subunit beta
MEITIRDGRVEHGNLDIYPIMRLKDAPKIEVHLALTAATKSGGVGEPGTAVVTAAPTNAIFAATGKPGCRSGDWSGVARRVRVLSGGGVRPM